MSEKSEAVPEPNTYWRARDGRRMRLDHWLPGRSKPTAFMVVLNPGYRMRKYSEQALDGFGSCLTMEEPRDNPKSDALVALGWARGPLREERDVTERTQTDATTDEAAGVIANLIATMSVWDRANMNSVAAGLAWLRAHDHPQLWLNASVREMMEQAGG